MYCKVLKKGICIVVAGFILLTSCGKNTAIQNDNGEAKVKYKKTVISVDVPENAEIGKTILQDGQVYFALSREENEYLLAHGSYKANVESSDTMNYELVYDGEASCYIRGYLNGSLQEEISFEEEIINKDYPFEIIPSEDDFLLISSKSIYDISRTGELKTKLSCPKEYFVAGVRSSNKKDYVFYSDGKKNYMSELPSGADALQNEREVPVFVRAVSEYDDTVYISDGKTIYALGNRSEDDSELLSLTDYNIVSSAVLAMEVFYDKVYILCSKGQENKMDLICLTKTDGYSGEERDENLYDAEGKRIVKLFARTDAYKYFITDEMIETFNLENPEYSVRICENEGSVDSVYIENEHPDIMFDMDIKLINDYISNGYLEDLTPYFNESSSLKIDDLYEVATECFTRDEKMYAIPQFVSVRTLMTREPGIKDDSVWEPEEFLDWLQSDEETFTLLTFNREQLLEYSIIGELDNNLYGENEKVAFDTDEFIRILEKVKKTKLPDETDVIMPRISHEIPDEWKTGRFFGNANLSTLGQICEEEYCFDGEVINRGFPNKKGETVCFLEPYTNLGIFETSECKEGAFEFIQFVLLYPEREMNDKSGRSAYFWTVDRIRESAFEIIDEDELGYEPFGTEVEFANELMSKAQVLPYEYRMVLDLVSEEVTAYFAGGRDAEQTAKIINSRVQLYLDENRN